MRLIPILCLVAASLAQAQLQAPEPTGLPALDACAAAVVANKDGAKQVTLCKEAVKEAVGKGNKFRVISYEYDAEAMLRNNQRDHALGQINDAIEHIDRGGIDEPTTARAYLIRAHCFEALKRVLEAEDSIKVAETHQRKALADANPEQHGLYANTLKSMLLYDAGLLKALNRDGDAIAARDEASKL